MAQFARPDSDVTGCTGPQGNRWSPCPLWPNLDEVAPSDGDLITSPTNPSPSQIAEVGLSDVTDPQSSDGHTVRVRRRKSGALGGGGFTLTVRLMQGATTIRSATFGADSTSFATGSFTLSAAQADSITDYTDLRLRFEPQGDGLLNDSIQVSWAEFESPDVAAGTTHELAGTSAGTTTATADLTVSAAPLELAGASSLTTTSAASLSFQHELAAAPGLTTTSAADLTIGAVPLELSGLAALTTTAAGDLEVGAAPLELAGTLTLGTTASADLSVSVAHALAGAVVLVTTATGDLEVVQLPRSPAQVAVVLASVNALATGQQKVGTTDGAQVLVGIAPTTSTSPTEATTTQETVTELTT